MCRMEICEICEICKTGKTGETGKTCEICEREDEFISFPRYCVLHYLNSVRNGDCV